MASAALYVNRETGKSYYAGGCLVNHKASTLPRFGISNTTYDLPPSVDLRQIMAPIEDQGDTRCW